MSAEPIALFIDLYLDADVHPALVRPLRAEGFDVISALEIKQATWSDENQLHYATSQRRAILTHNTKHFIPLAQCWFKARRDHCGIIVSERLEVGEILHRLLRLLDRVPKDEMYNQVRFLADFADKA